jgi:hypothetical protein
LRLGDLVLITTACCMRCINTKCKTTLYVCMCRVAFNLSQLRSTDNHPSLVLVLSFSRSLQHTLTPDNHKWSVTIEGFGKKFSVDEKAAVCVVLCCVATDRPPLLRGHAIGVLPIHRTPDLCPIELHRGIEARQGLAHQSGQHLLVDRGCRQQHHTRSATTSHLLLPPNRNRCSASDRLVRCQEARLHRNDFDGC